MLASYKWGAAPARPPNLLIDARDLNEAIQAAAKIPPAREGSIEVRPVRELDPS